MNHKYFDNLVTHFSKGGNNSVSSFFCGYNNNKQPTIDTSMDTKTGTTYHACAFGHCIISKIKAFIIIFKILCEFLYPALYKNNNLILIKGYFMICISTTREKLEKKNISTNVRTFSI